MTDVQTAEQAKVSAGDHEEPRTVNRALADLESEINGLWHSTPSGTESAVIRMRGHLKELRGFVDPNSPQAKADAAKKAEADRLALAQKQAEAQKAQAAERDRVAEASRKAQANVTG